MDWETIIGVLGRAKCLNELVDTAGTPPLRKESLENNKGG